MSAVAPVGDQATDLLQTLSLETKNKTGGIPEITKKPSGIQHGPTNGWQAPEAQISSLERSMNPMLPEFVDHNLCFMPNGYPSTAFYFGGYDGSMAEWEEYARYWNHEGHGLYGDMFHHGYGYTPYGAYPCSSSPVPAVGHDSQIYGAQHYQYPSPNFQQQASSNASLNSNNVPLSNGEVAPPVSSDQPPMAANAAKSNSSGIPNGSVNGNAGPQKQNQQNVSLNSNCSFGNGLLPAAHPSSVYGDPRFNFGGRRSPIPWFDTPSFSSPNFVPATTNVASSTSSYNTSFAPSKNQNIRPLPQQMGLHSPRPTLGMGQAASGFSNRVYPTNQMYGQYGQYGQCGNAFRAGVGFGSNLYDSSMNGYCGMYGDGKYKPRGSGYAIYGHGNYNLDGLSELNRGPRSNFFKSQKGPVPTLTIGTKAQNPLNENVCDPCVVPDREQYNRADFPEKYSDGKFFIIKSYSEDDIHKSIKYNVWASTPNGNKKLDAAYKESKDKADGCPVFLFFSVNTSGQFVGVAEMVGSVDFNKTVDYWQQDKWIGCFNVKWHIVKDIPNSILKHITLEDNDNKPVTNSRDTQEVKLEQGLQMLKIFKEHISKTSILDDFQFYETRQKAMMEKRARQPHHNKQIDNGKLTESVSQKDKDASNGNIELQKPSEAGSVLKKEVIQDGLDEHKPSDDNLLTEAVSGDVLKEAKPVTECNVK